MLTRHRHGHSLLHFDPVAERRLVRKIDLYIVPTVALLYLFCFIDRANIGKTAHFHAISWHIIWIVSGYLRVAEMR
jgi:hypothetical protein